MPSQRNIDNLEKIKARIKEAQGYYFTNFSGLTVQSITDLRKELKKEEIDYMVVKNRLLTLALRERGIDVKQLSELFKGQIGLAIAINDGYLPARILNKLEKNFPPFKLKGALIDGELFIDEKLKSLCLLPTKSQIEGRLVSVLANPMANFTNILFQLISQLVVVIDKIRDRRNDVTEEKVNS